MSHFWSRPFVFCTFALLLLALPGQAESPRRAMVLVFDQMRAEYIDRFDLPNFKRARAMGVNFPNGIVGHLESNTIISHPVITTGKQPRNLPWAGHVMKDVLGLLGPKDEFYNPFKFSGEQYTELTRQTSGDSSLIARIKQRHPGPALAVAQKRYAAWNFGGPYADVIVGVGAPSRKVPGKAISSWRVAMCHRASLSRRVTGFI